MPTLPDTTTAFASSATEAQFKTFLSSQRSFLAGLLGTDGTAVTARSTLGVNDGVTSVNGNTGAITAAQIAAAATAGYGYTPANPANCVSTNMTAGAVGSLCYAKRDTALSISVAHGSTVSGSVLVAFGENTNGAIATTPLSGTWRCLGAIASSPSTAVAPRTLFQRIS